MKLTKKFLLILFAVIFTLGLLTFGIYRYIEYREYQKASPYDVLISDIYANSVTISWKTDVDTSSYIKIGKSEKLWGDEERTKFHRIRLQGLKELSEYSFSISDGKRNWEEPLKNSVELESFVLKEFKFSTVSSKEEILLPEVEELNVLPNEIIYVVLEKVGVNQQSEVRSFTANRFGGVAVDINSFYTLPEGEDVKIKNIEYVSTKRENKSLIPLLFSSEINCNQNVSNQSFDGLSKEKFAELATRWVAGRGKNYAKECYNDVIYRAKKEGVDPGFALTIWLNESGASNYTQNMSIYGMVEDFGIHGLASVPPQNFSKQIDHFLKLTHNYQCPGLSAWEAWGNIYRWGNCNENDAVKRQVGIDYYKGIENVYGWVTNGRKLPAKVTGLPKSDDGGENGDGWGNVSGPLCCALKIDNKEEFQGDFENNVEGKTCEQVWAVGRSLYGGKLEYSVEIKDKVAEACEVKYEGVCCQLQNDIKWWPKIACTKAVPNITSNQACKEYANDRACFFREGKYQWLPKSIGNDAIEGVTTQSQCDSRNKLSQYKIQLQKGINFVGFDFSPTYQASTMYASKLIEMNPNILLIGNFEGYGWKDLIKKSEKLPFAGNDFFFEQNKGYLIITTDVTEIEFDGWKDSAAKYSKLSEGWNLVGGTLYSKSYRASSLIQALSKEEINVDTVGVWATDLGRFNYRKEEGTNVYGEDILLKNNEGVFLKNKVK